VKDLLAAAQVGGAASDGSGDSLLAGLVWGAGLPEWTQGIYE